MANQVKVAMQQTIITLHEQGWSNRRIARELGLHRETVRGYVNRHKLASGSKAAISPPGSEACNESKAATPPPGSGAAGGEAVVSRFWRSETIMADIPVPPPPNIKLPIETHLTQRRYRIYLAALP